MNHDTQWHMLAELFETIQSRKGASPESSYTASLFAKGRDKIAQKLGEEAVETAMAAAKNDKAETITESADVLYHLLTLWSAMEIKPEEVMEILSRRTAHSGIEEKNNRKG